MIPNKNLWLWFLLCITCNPEREPHASTFACITWELTKLGVLQAGTVPSQSQLEVDRRWWSRRELAEVLAQRPCHYAQRRLTSISPRIRACVKRIRDLPLGCCHLAQSHLREHDTRFNLLPNISTSGRHQVELKMLKRRSVGQKLGELVSTIRNT